MPWILFALAFVCFALLCLTKSVGFGLICMLLALLFLFAGLMKLLAMRVGGGTRDDARILTTEELRVWREQAQEKKRAAAENAATGPAQPTQTRTDTSPPPPAST